MHALSVLALRTPVARAGPPLLPLVVDLPPEAFRHASALNADVLRLVDGLHTTIEVIEALEIHAGDHALELFELAHEL